MNRSLSPVVLSLILALLYSGLITVLVDSNASASVGSVAEIEPLSLGESAPRLPAGRDASVLRLRLTLPYMPSGPVRRESQEI